MITFEHSNKKPSGNDIEEKVDSIINQEVDIDLARFSPPPEGDFNRSFYKKNLSIFS
jgi:hypothetical protein